MKKILLLICIAMLIFTTVVMAESSNDLSEIKALLESGKIKNYETILIPLEGDPENFNILPTDDLSTIAFGKGVEGYKVNFGELETAYNTGEKNVSPYLEKEYKYYFPIFVSGREVAMAEIIKEDGEYRVFSVSGGILFDNFIDVKDNIDLDKAKYITESNAINGLVIYEGSNESFIDLDVVKSEATISTARMTTDKTSLVEEFMKRKTKSMENATELGGNGVNEKTTKNTIYMARVFFVLICVGAILVLRKRKTK